VHYEWLEELGIGKNQDFWKGFEVVFEKFVFWERLSEIEKPNIIEVDVYLEETRLSKIAFDGNFVLFISWRNYLLGIISRYHF
jgi:hypothetical protein